MKSNEKSATEYFYLINYSEFVDVRRRKLKTDFFVALSEPMHASRIKTVLTRIIFVVLFWPKAFAFGVEEDARLEANERAALKIIRRRCKVTESTACKVGGRSELFAPTHESASICIKLRLCSRLNNSRVEHTT